jgi:hypothetical protein
MRIYDLFETTTPFGSNVTTYFETAQGSKYILTSNNECRRIKSVHANTGGDDQGLKKWNSNAVFVSPEFTYQANAYQFLYHRVDHVLVHISGDLLALCLVENGKWRVAKMSEAYPKGVAAGAAKEGPIAFKFTKTPTVNFNIVEYNLKAKNIISSYHYGSPVSVIKPIAEISPEILASFKIDQT